MLPSRGGGRSPGPAAVGRGRGRARGATSPHQPSPPKPPGTGRSLPPVGVQHNVAGGLSVKACITSMASGIDTCDLEFYFETICEMMCDGKVKVLAPLLLGSGKAEIVLKGLTVEGLQKLECRDHKIKGKQVKVEFQQLPEFDGGPPPLDDVGDGRSTKLEVSNVPVTVTADILRAFFEGAKSGGCADAVAEVNRINPGVFHVTFHDHKVAARVISEPRKFKKEILQMRFVEEASCEREGSGSEEEPNQIEVHNVPDTVNDKPITDKHVTAYFEGAKSGGCANAVAECKQIRKGVFNVTFYDPKVAAQVMSRGHTFKKATLQLQFVRQVKQEAEFQLNQLTIHGLPDGVEKDIYEVIIAGCLDMEEDDDFKMQISGSSAVITFAKDYSAEELQKMADTIASEQVNGATVTVEMVKTAKPSIRVSNVTATMCDEEFLKMYFGSAKRSGGGEVESVKILSATEAIITFSDPAVIQSVLGRPHPALGPDAVVEGYGGNTSPCVQSAEVSIPTQPLEIPLDPLLAQSISRSPSNLEQSLGSRVTFSADEGKGMLVFSPTSQSKPGWRQKCLELVPQYIAENLTKEEIHVPREAAAHAMSIAVKLEKENPGLRVDPNSDGTVITVAGETSSVVQAKEAIDKICSELVTGTASVILSPKDFDFIEQVKQYDLPANIECKFDPSTFKIHLKGPVGAVTKLKDSIEDFSSHLDSPVMLDPLVTEFFKTQAGRGKLEKFLQDRQCRVALHFSQFPNLTLHLLSDHKGGNVKAVMAHIPLYVTSQAIPIPEAVIPIISDLEDFIQLCQDVETKHGVLLKHVGQEVSAAGFKTEVTSSLAKIKRFLDERSSPLPPTEMKVGTLVARSLHQSPQGMQKCLQPFYVSLQIDTGGGILHFSPLHYLKPGWEEACKSSVSEYIQSNVNEAKLLVPEKAYQEIMSLLYTTQQDDSTFVFNYPPQTTSLSFAGEPKMVKSTETRIAQICANYSYLTEEMVLKPEEYEFLNQLKMQDLANKFRSVEIEPVPDNHSLLLSGPTKGVKAVKEYIPTLTAHTTVAVDLDQAIVQFLASEKGKEKLFNLLREKRCDKCATYLSESPLKLLLLCAPKHKKAAVKVVETLLECTSVKPLQIPDLLLPILSELPEFSKEVRRLEKETLAMISVKGKEIIVAGFKDGVSQAIETLSAFVRGKMAHFQPIQMPIDPMIAKCIQDNIVGLQACMSSINVHCTLKTDKTTASVSISPTKTTESDWKKECKKLLDSYIDREYLSVKMEIPKLAASKIFPILMSTQKESTFHFESHDDGSYAVVSGERNVVQAVQARIDGICKQMQTSDTISLSHRDYDFFTQVAKQKIESRVAVDCSPGKHSVTFTGSIHEVNVLKKSMKEVVRHSVVPVIVDEVVVHFINTNGKQRFENSIQRKGLEAAIHINMSVHPPTLELLCDHQLVQHVQKLSEAFPEQIETTSIQLPTSVTTPPVSEEFNEHCQQLIMQYHVSIQTKEDILQICGFKDSAVEVKKSAELFVKKKCTVKQSFPIQKGVWRLFCGPMKHKWLKIEVQCRDNEVTLTQPSDDEGKIVITVKGDKVEVQKVLQAMNQLVRSVQRSNVPLLRPAVRKYFNEGEDGKMKIPHIEKSARVCIEVCEVGEDMDTEVPEMRSTTRNTQKPVKECTAEVVDMKRITIYVGDITEFRADVIVNAANEDLKHSGGVADAILKKGGQEIQVASDHYVSGHGKLSAGEVWLSPVVGRLPCLALIHVVGPRWHGNPSERQQLESVCIRCLKAAKAYNSIALPAISSGVFGCPIDQCASILISAAIDFCNTQRNSCLDEINFVLFKQSDVPHFVRVLQAHLSPQNIRQKSDKVSSGASAYRSAHNYSDSSRSSHASYQPLEEEFEEIEELEEDPIIVGNPSSLSRVFVQQGSILDVEAEIYVNSTNGNMDLSGGAVAQALAKAAGPSLQAECTKKAPIAAGEIAVTGPGKILRCKCIIHINCPGYDQSGGQAESMLRTIMNKCMKECDRKGASTIVFPAIGTGNLRFPVVTAAHIMVDEVCNYLEKNKCKSLSMVHFIIFMENMYRTFCDELEKRKQESGSVAQPHIHKITKVKKDKKKSRGCREESLDLAPQRNFRGRQVSEQSQMPAEATTKHDCQSVDLGSGISVEIIKGDITSETTDVIVNTTGRDMNLKISGGVAAALLKKAGKDLEKACEEKRKKKQYLSDGKVIDTRPGKLQCKRVFHIYFQKGSPIEDVIRACIERAVELKFTSIAFPGIGTGVEGFPPADAAKGMIRGLQQYTPPHDLHVRIVLFQDKVYRAFKAVTDNHQSSWLQRTGRAVKNWLSWGQREQEDEVGIDVDPQENETEMELRIFGETEKCVKSAEDSLHTLINKQFKTEYFEDDRISSLKPSQVNILQGKAREMQVTFHIDRNINNIELKGSKDSIAEMKVEIEKALSKVEKETSRRAQAETMMKIMQWKRQDSTGVDEYDPETNLEIEETYTRGEPKYTFKGAEHFTIDFKKMEEIDHAMGEKTCKVKRVTEGSEGLPAYWEPMTDPTSGKEVPLLVVDLAATSTEYKFVLTEFNKTMKNYKTIAKIERIQNPALYGQYAAKKKHLDTYNPKGVLNERWLFHGTRESSISQINKTNFNRSFSGQNGTVYGQGCYFARDASYSNRYASSDSQGMKHMYVVRVLTGEFTPGNGQMIVAPPKDPSDNTVLFDSVVDNTTNPSIYVVFYDADAYPEYLITYT